MRSQQVFRANERIGNRYLLCRLTAKTTRRLHFVSASTSDAIEDAFVRLGVVRSPGDASITAEAPAVLKVKVHATDDRVCA